MNRDNASAQENNTSSNFLEVFFTDHNLAHAALFCVILVSLILGLPISWNLLWHLKASSSSLWRIKLEIATKLYNFTN